jgi:hypothetical protein
MHRFRVTLPGKRHVDFGSVVVESYVDHKSPERMRYHLHVAGGKIPQGLRKETDPYEIHRGMLWVEESLECDWDDPETPQYWDRWLLQSYPTVEQAKLFMTMRKGMLFMPIADNFFYID